MPAKIDPMLGNNCKTCEWRFNCFSGNDRICICPKLHGEEIENCFVYYDNLAVSTKQGLLRMKAEEILKLLRQTRFKVEKKRSLYWISVED